MMLYDVMAMPDSDVETKLAAARTRLILDKPFLGALVLRLPLKEASPPGAAPPPPTRAILLQPRLHRHAVAGADPVRAGARGAALRPVPLRAPRPPRAAALGSGLRFRHQPAAGEGRPAAAAGGAGARPVPGHDGGGDLSLHRRQPGQRDAGPAHLRRRRGRPGPGQPGRRRRRGESRASRAAAPPPSAAAAATARTAAKASRRRAPLSQQEREDLERQWEQYVASAASRAQQAGRLVRRSWRGWWSDRLQPQLPWRAAAGALLLSQTARERLQLHAAVAARGRDDPAQPAQPAQCELVVALDTSRLDRRGRTGRSSSPRSTPSRATLPVRVTLLACDAGLAEGGPWLFEPWEAFALPRKFQGGGGTDFTPGVRLDRAARICAPTCCSTSPTPTANSPTPRRPSPCCGW
ncbi:MAG: hypothetical protein MZW92_05640 [Comamonadaceae bacterium]|nr:hypothetical protein [Comamonadaceae bacterium]